MSTRLRIASFSWSLFVAAVLACPINSTIVVANEDTDDLARMQGTWRLVMYETNGAPKLPTSESLYVFSGNRLYKKSKVLETAFAITLDTSKSPKWMDQTCFLEGGYKDKTPEKLIFKFHSDRLVIAGSQQPFETRPLSFNTANDKTAGMVKILRKVSDDTTIPEKILKRFIEPTPVEATRNTAAEAVLRQVLLALATGASVETIRPLIINGTDAEIMELSHPKPTDTEREAISRGMATIVIRDIQPGERLIFSDGSELVVGESQVNANSTLLMIVEERADQGSIAMAQSNGQWKVDLQSLLDQKNQMTAGLRLFEGIRHGMTFDRVHELLLGYKKNRSYKSYSVNQPGDGTIVVDCDSGMKMIRHVFGFKDGKLSNYSFSPR